MKFSIVIPVYNSEKFITECINSLKNQIYTNIEIIIVDDGSTDSTGKVINEIIETSPNFDITYTKIKNSGPGAARNIGIKRATGDYICFLDSDDQYDKRLFFELNNLLKDEEICFFGWIEKNFLTNKVISKYDDRFKFLDESISGIKAAKLKYKTEIWLCNCNEVYNLEFIKKNNIKYPEKVYYGEDTNFIYKSLCLAEKVTSLNKNYFINSIRSNSLMHSNYSEKNATQINSLNDLVDFAKRYNLDYEVINNFESLRYYSLIEGTKKIARSVGFFNVFKYHKIRKKYIMKLDYRKTYDFSKSILREVKIYNFSKTLYFFVVKFFDLWKTIKSKGINEHENQRN